MKEVKVLILGSDANAYYMARCYYEKYQKKAHLIAKDKLAFTKYSNILTISYYDTLWDEKEFVKILNEYANSDKEQQFLVVSTNETYSLFLAKNRNKLAVNLVFCKQNPHVLETLTNKEQFYKTYRKSVLSFPKTYFFDVTKNTIIPSLDYPIIIKPANVVMYNHLSFKGKNKIYKIETQEEALKVISTIKEAGYKDWLIIQEFIDGDDSCLYDSVVYVDRTHQVKLISFAQIGLQEHTKSMVGNAAVLINGFSTHQDAPIKQMKEDIITFMEQLDYTGFAEIDMKYDTKAKTFKVLEINARQGRCSYYLTPLNANLIEVLMNDLIYQKKLKKRELTDEVLLSFVPKQILKKYIKNEEFKEKALKMWKHRVNPVNYPKDYNWKRYLLIKKRLHAYKKEYENGYWHD